MTLLFEPFAPLFELSRELDRFAPGGRLRSFVPATDVIVGGDEVLAHMDVPGLNVDDLTIELQGDVLTVRGERVFPYATGTEGDGRAWQRLERGFGEFERVLRVPTGLDPDAIQATMADGVLTLRIPRPQARTPRRIQISTTGAQPVLEGEARERELAESAA